jgi:hypothetical protein
MVSLRYVFGAYLVSLAASGVAQYQATILPNPPGHIWSVGRGAAFGSVSGYSVPPGSVGVGDDRAIIWINNQPVDVTPPAYFSARILNSRNGMHVGNVAASLHGQPLAYLWDKNGAGTLLHPVGFTSSLALGVGGGRQVGQIVLSSTCFECGYFVERHAVLWSGTSQSLELLHSPGLGESRPVDTDGVTHVGSSYLGALGRYRAILWYKSNAAVSLHGSGFESTFATAVDGKLQVGWGDTGTAMHALLWKGSAESVVDLHPQGYELSIANSVAANVQVGSGRPAGSFPDRALLWKGTKESVVDLHQFLPPGFRENHSVAEDVSRDGTIIGTCTEDSTGLTRAVVWKPVP